MIFSPLRYPGGKAKLFPYFAELIRCNKLFGAEYCEPYAGGAGLAIKLLTGGFVDKISINDIDQSIYAFWLSALFDTENFCRLLDRTPITIDEWYRQQEIWETSDTDNILSLGFAAFFLNRTNRSGIIEGAGPIGGYDQRGKWKVDARLVKLKQIENIKALAQYSGQIELSNVDAFDFIQRKIKADNSLLYLDPPYFVKGRKLYKNFYEPSDHVKIANELKRNRRSNWVVSYDDVPQIRAAYETFSPITYLLNYSAGEKSDGAEVIFLSDELTAPVIEGFNIHHRRRVAKGKTRRKPRKIVAKQRKERSAKSRQPVR